MWLTALGGHSEWRTIAKTGRPGCCSYLLNSQFQYRAWVKDASQSCTYPLIFILFCFIFFIFDFTAVDHNLYGLCQESALLPCILSSMSPCLLLSSHIALQIFFPFPSLGPFFLPCVCSSWFIFCVLFSSPPFDLSSLFMSSVSFFFLVTYFFVSPLSFLLIFFLHFVLLSFYILLYSYFFVFLLYSCLMSFIFSMLPCVLIPFITCVLPSNCMSFILSLPLLHFFLVFFVCLWTFLYFMLKFSTLQNHLP